MKRMEDFSEVIRVVSELTEVSQQDILGKSREQGVVDARWMVIYLMREKGYTSNQIVPLMCHPLRTINHAYSSFEDRVKYSNSELGNILATARQLLR